MIGKIKYALYGAILNVQNFILSHADDTGRSLRFQTGCFVSKSERVTGDCARKSRSNIFHFLPAVNFRGKVGKICLSEFFQVQPRTKPVIYINWAKVFLIVKIKGHERNTKAYRHTSGGVNKAYFWLRAPVATIVFEMVQRESPATKLTFCTLTFVKPRLNKTQI